MNLLLVGTSHRRAPVEVRERVALDADRAAELGAQLAAETGGEAVLLSTCNRTEIYLSAPEAASPDSQATELLEELAGAELEPYLYRLEDHAAALHLFRVAAGLDSLVPGEGEILGQVRTAYERGTVGPLLDRVFNLALHTGKKVRTETAIAESPGTTSSAAAALAAQVFGELHGSRIAIVGAGKIGTRAARRLIKRGASLSFVANRTDARGRAVANELGGETIPLERVTDAVASCDILVSSTSSPELVLTKDDVAGVLAARKGRPLLLIDLAVPRDLDPAINELGDCYLYDIDDLQAVVEETTRGREAEFAKAEAIAVAEGEKFSAWLSTRDVAPVIASLRQRAEEIRRSELAKASGRLAGLSEGERNAVESVTTQIVNKLLHEPIVRLKEAAAEEHRGPESRLEG
jgi:glutamyl-tRNA reductase